MSRVLRLIALLLLAALSALAAPDPRVARLSEQHRKWLDEEVVYIMSERERDAFLDLEAPGDREAFIDAFWRKRDPDPVTPSNEFREEHYRRIQYANRELGRETAVPGWKTDRGKMYITLGAPRDRESFMSVPGLNPAEVWFYEGSRERGLSSPFFLLFFKEGAGGGYQLYHQTIHGPEKLFPAHQFSFDSRMEAYDLLKNVSADLAHASITPYADRSALPGVLQPVSFDIDELLTQIARSPYFGLDTSYVDGASRGRGVVESDYLFNYVPSSGVSSVLPGPGGAAFVHWSLEIEPQYLSMVGDSNRYYTSFDLRGEVTTPDGKIVAQFSRQPYVELTPSQFKEVSSRPFAYREMFPLVPGDYQLRIVLKNRARTEYTIFETPLHVPRWQGQVLGEPVLLYKVERGADLGYRTYQAGPYVFDPNARRVYAVGQSLWVYVPFVGASRGQEVRLRVVNLEKPGETLLSKTTPASPEGEPHVESLTLDKMVGGHYQLVVELLDGGRVAARRAADFDVTPRTTLFPPWVLRDSIKPEEPGVLSAALAEQHLRLGEKAEARGLCEEAVAQNPGLPLPALFLARLLLDEGSAHRAVSVLEPARASASQNYEFLVTLGDAYSEVHDYAKAVEVFEAALPLGRAEPALLNSLAAAHVELGNRGKAAECLRKSLELNPSQKAVRTLLEKLQGGK